MELLGRALCLLASKGRIPTKILMQIYEERHTRALTHLLASCSVLYKNSEIYFQKTCYTNMLSTHFIISTYPRDQLSIQAIPVAKAQYLITYQISLLFVLYISPHQSQRKLLIMNNRAEGVSVHRGRQRLSFPALSFQQETQPDGHLVLRQPRKCFFK